MSFTLGGKTPKELGFRVLEDQQDPVLTATRNRVVEIPEKNGAYDFGADLGEKSFYFPCAFVTEGTDYSSPSAAELQKKVRALAAHLIDSSGRPKNLILILDRESDKYYTVRYTGELPIQRIAYQSFGFFTLPLVAYDPIAYADITEYDENNQYDTGLQYDSGLIYDNPESFEWLYASHMSGIYNWSQTTTPLILTIVGTVTNPSITNADTGETITITAALSGQTLVIDGKKMQVTIDGVNKLNLMSGDFVQLQQGSNGLTFSGTSPNATVTYNWAHKFV